MVEGKLTEATTWHLFLLFLRIFWAGRSTHMIETSIQSHGKIMCVASSRVWQLQRTTTTTATTTTIKTARITRTTKETEKKHRLKSMDCWSLFHAQTLLVAPRVATLEGGTQKDCSPMKHETKKTGLSGLCSLRWLNFQTPQLQTTSLSACFHVELPHWRGDERGNVDGHWDLATLTVWTLRFLTSGFPPTGCFGQGGCCSCYHFLSDFKTHPEKHTIFNNENAGFQMPSLRNRRK